MIGILTGIGWEKGLDNAEGAAFCVADFGGEENSLDKPSGEFVVMLGLKMNQPKHEAANESDDGHFPAHF